MRLGVVLTQLYETTSNATWMTIKIMRSTHSLYFTTITPPCADPFIWYPRLEGFIGDGFESSHYGSQEWWALRDYPHIGYPGSTMYPLWLKNLLDQHVAEED